MLSLLPPDACLHFLSRIGFSIPTAGRFSTNVANSRFSLINFIARKSPCEYALDETWTHEIDLSGHVDHLLGTGDDPKILGTQCSFGVFSLNQGSIITEPYAR